MHIEDRPRFPWRGLMLDVGAALDAASKWSSATSTPWRRSSSTSSTGTSPTTRASASRASVSQAARAGLRRTLLHAGRDPRRRGVRARPRHPRGPGVRHARPHHAWLVGYPELASGPGPYHRAQVGHLRTGLDPTREETYKFLDGFFGEMAALFPDPTSTSAATK